MPVMSAGEEARAERAQDVEGADAERLLEHVRAGDEDAAGALFELLYAELYRLAHRAMRHQSPEHTLQPTAIVNEAYLRLIGGSPDWQNREHFLLSASQAMRHVLVDHSRGKASLKRRPKGSREPLEGIVARFEESAFDLEALDLALLRLKEMDERMSRAVELRFFGGASVEETARILDMKVRTFERSWAAARAWLHGQLR